MNLTRHQWKVLRACAEMKARDAENGDNDQGLVDAGLLDELPSALDLRSIAFEIDREFKASFVFDEGERIDGGDPACPRR